MSQILSDVEYKILEGYLKDLQAENSKLETTLKGLNLLECGEIMKIATNIAERQIKLQAKSNDEHVLKLSEQHVMLQNHHVQTSKNALKNEVRLLDKENNKALVDVEQSKKALQSVKSQSKHLEPLKYDEAALKSKSSIYQEHLAKLQKHLKGFNITSITNEMKQLRELECEKSVLEEKLSKFEGLAPDLKEAQLQVQQLKSTLNNFNFK